MTAYKIGHCAQCATQVMVQDSDGRWNSFKSNFRNADLEFIDGHVVRVPLCVSCLESPDFEKIMDALLHDESEAGGEIIKGKLRFLKRRKLPKENEIIANGKLYKRIEIGDKGKKLAKLSIEGKEFEEAGEWDPYDRLERGLPVRIKSWGFPSGRLILNVR